MVVPSKELYIYNISSPSAMTSSFSPEQPAKADEPMEVTFPGISMEVSRSSLQKLMNLWRLHFPGISMEVSPEQPAKADEPMEVTFPGISMEVKAEHPAKASLLIFVTFPGISMEVSPEQPSKADFPIVCNAFGDFQGGQLGTMRKADSFIVVTPSGIL